MPADSTDTGIVLKGNAESYPGAFIEFRASVTRKDPKPAPSTDAVSAAGSQSNSRAAADAEESKNNALSGLLKQKIKTLEAQNKSLQEEN